MSDSGVAPFPQLFVVDSQATCVSVPTGRKARWAGMGQKVLLFLMALAMLGLVVQATFIYSLYRKVEAFSHCVSHPFCQNQSSLKIPDQQVGALSRFGSKDHNDVSMVDHVDQIQKRPFAQLMGSDSPDWENNEVQWKLEHDGTTLNHMGLSKGRLVVQMKGHYYLYSKLTLNAAEECSLVQHTVMKVTKAYDQPLELLKSKNSHCAGNRKKPSKSPVGEDLRNSFLAGIFLLDRGDEIYVTLEDIRKIRKGPTENMMGAFMIAP